MNILDIVTKGSTDRSVTIRIIDETTGLPETAVEHNSPGIDLWYRREGGGKVALTEVALATLTTAHTDGGIEHIGDGVYRLDLPDSAYATGANYVDVGGTVTGMIVIGGRVRLIDTDPEDAASFGLSNLDASMTSRQPSGPVTVGTNSDKTGYSLSQSFPTNFADLSITAGTGRVTVGTNNDKAGYQISGTLNTLDDLDTQQDAQHAATRTDIGNLNDLDDAGIRAALGMSEADLDAQLAAIFQEVDVEIPAVLADIETAVDTEVQAILDIADKLDGMLEDDGASGFQFTALALDNAPSGGGGGGDATLDNQNTIISTVNAIKTITDTLPAGVKVIEVDSNAVEDIFSTHNIAEAYTTNEADGTPGQILYELLQTIVEASISGNTLTVRQRDGSTVATTHTLTGTHPNITARSRAT